MRMTKLLTIMLFLLPLAMGETVTAEVSFKASVDKVNTAYEEKVLLDLEVTVSDPLIETKPLPPPAMLGFRIGGSVSSVTQEGGSTIRHYRYELVPSKSGAVEIPAFALVYGDSTGVDTLYSQPIVVTVAQPLPPQEEGTTPWTVIIIAIVVLGGGTYWWLRRRQPASEPAVEPEWQAEYRDRLSEAIELAQRQKYRDFFDRGSRLLVDLFATIYETPLKGKTVDDLRDWIKQQDMSDEVKGMATDFLRQSESVKFTSGQIDPRSADAQAAELRKIVERLLA